MVRERGVAYESEMSNVLSNSLMELKCITMKRCQSCKFFYEHSVTFDLLLIIKSFVDKLRYGIGLISAYLIYKLSGSNWDKLRLEVYKDAFRSAWLMHTFEVIVDNDYFLITKRSYTNRYQYIRCGKGISLHVYPNVIFVSFRTSRKSDNYIQFIVRVNDIDDPHCFNGIITRLAVICNKFDFESNDYVFNNYEFFKGVTQEIKMQASFFVKNIVKSGYWNRISYRKSNALREALDTLQCELFRVACAIRNYIKSGQAAKDMMETFSKT